MKTPLVSILICTYNASSTIKETILSCLGQTHTNIEILIHDDQSIDNTIEIIKKIDDKRLYILSSWKKLWPYKGLNFLLDHARGEYIAIQDHDDLRNLQKIEKQINFLESEEWKRYIWCWTSTLMWYESDQRGFEYFLWKENYYTIHPSLVFRNQWYKYPIKSIYMNDALFQKVVLCKGERLIYNINETLTFHRIKDGASNFSYKRFTYSWATIHTVFSLHPLWYSICIIGWETMRKFTYPILQCTGKEKWIDIIERKPFEILGEKINNYSRKKLKYMGFIIF